MTQRQIDSLKSEYATCTTEVLHELIRFELYFYGQTEAYTLIAQELAKR